MVEALARSVVWKGQNARLILRAAATFYNKTQRESEEMLTVLVAGVQLFNKSTFNQRQRSSLLLGDSQMLSINLVVYLFISPFSL